MGLQSAALVQMGRFYGFPATSAGMTSDAKEPGAEAVIEKLITTIPGVQVGSDIIVGFGEIESDQALYLEQILIDNEIAHLCERLVQGVDVSEAKDLFADIAKIGPGGHFLAEKTTRAAARSNEFYKTQFSNHQAYESWMTLGKPSMYSNARTKVEEILSSPPVDPLPDDINGKLEDILKRADRALKDLEG
jgi:trimethylamine---corrinoid protein Co-methyltransferase